MKNLMPEVCQIGSDYETSDGYESTRECRILSLLNSNDFDNLGARLQPHPIFARNHLSSATSMPVDQRHRFILGIKDEEHVPLFNLPSNLFDLGGE